MTTYEIIELYLRSTSYDGLWNSDYDCSCVLDDLFPCDNINDGCLPAYKTPCDCTDEYTHDYHMSTIKPKIEGNQNNVRDDL